MTLDVYKVLEVLKKDIQNRYSNIEFDYEIKGSGDSEEAWVTADVTLNGFDDDIRLIFQARAGGGVQFRAVFDKLEKTDEVLVLLNEFNAMQHYFKLFVRNDGYLEAAHEFVCSRPETLVEYPSDCMWRLSNLTDNEIMKALTAYTN